MRILLVALLLVGCNTTKVGQTAEEKSAIVYAGAGQITTMAADYGEGPFADPLAVDVLQETDKRLKPVMEAMKKNAQIIGDLRTSVKKLEDLYELDPTPELEELIRLKRLEIQQQQQALLLQMQNNKQLLRAFIRELVTALGGM